MQLGIKVWKKSTLTALNFDNILNIKDDTNSVLWEENITSFLLIKVILNLQITEDIVLPMDIW